MCAHRGLRRGHAEQSAVRWRLRGSCRLAFALPVQLCLAAALCLLGAPWSAACHPGEHAILLHCPLHQPHSMASSSSLCFDLPHFITRMPIVCPVCLLAAATAHRRKAMRRSGGCAMWA